MKDVRADLQLAIKHLAYLRGRIEHLPTTWTLVTSIAASQAALLGVHLHHAAVLRSALLTGLRA